MSQLKGIVRLLVDSGKASPSPAIGQCALLAADADAGGLHDAALVLFGSVSLRKGTNALAPVPPPLVPPPPTPSPPH